MPRGYIGYLVGYRASNIYRIWVPQLNQVITTRNVTFNEELFYSGSKEPEVITTAEATALAELLYEPGDIINRGDAEELPINEQNLSLDSFIKQQLGGRAALEPELTDSQSGNDGAIAAPPARAVSLANKPQEIGAGRLGTGLLTP